VFIKFIATQKDFGFGWTCKMSEEEIAEDLLNALAEILRDVLSQEELERAMRHVVIPRGVSDKLKESLFKIYTFRIIATPDDLEWKERISEEIKAFLSFKTSKYGDLLPHFFSLNPIQGKRRTLLLRMANPFQQGKRLWAWVTLPVAYPYSPPTKLVSQDGKFEVYTSHTDTSKCLGDIVKNRWSPRFGIAHWLLFVEIYISLMKSPLKI